MKNYIFILVLGFGLSLWACKPKEKEKQKEEIVAVEVATVVSKSLNQGIEAAGTLSSKSEIKLAFKTGGLIKKIYVEEGQTVKAGQLLAELDLSEITTQANQAQYGLNKALRDLNRVKKMYADEAATETNLQDATTAYDIAKQSVDAIAFNQKLSKIIAPSSGRILRKLSQQGELITPFSPAFILGTGAEAYIVNVGLSDRDVVKAKIGNLAKISLEAYPGEFFNGRISNIAQIINPATGTFNVELEIIEPSKKLISGFMAKAVILPNNAKVVLIAPVSALVEANNSTATVFCVENNIAIKKKIIIGEILNDAVEVIEGLSSTDRVIVKGGGFLVDKQKINIINP